jgi:DNA repair protein RecN (Recombination protein N)
MLRHLLVKDFAIIDSAEIHFGPGMTALTGETGTGKSLIIDALMLLAGGRGDAGAVRHGAERAELTAEFDLAALPEVRARLAELEVDEGHDCRLRRVQRADGTSRAFINDRPVTLSTLRELGESLIEIHGQHEHQALLNRAHQLALLDGYAGHEELTDEVARAAQHWRDTAARSRTLTERGASPQNLDFLRFQLDELDKHVLSAADVRELEAEHKRLAHGGELLEGTSAALDALDGDHEHPIRGQLAHWTIEFERLAATDPHLAPVQNLLRDAEVAVSEACESLSRYREGRDFDPERLAQVDAQLARLHDLARKHRVGMAELTDVRDRLRAEFDGLADLDQHLARAQQAEREALAQYEKVAALLSAQRHEAAQRFERSVSAIMAELGMAGGTLSVQFEAQPPSEPQRSGRDTIEFLVSANPGQPPRALRKTASGGELARISLAIEVAALGKDRIATMVFDEVDAGIGGAVAEVVGRRLHALARSCQVLCVTHLPQVAAQADHHVAVRKHTQGKTTRTELRVLDREARVEETARMLGGIEITTETRRHAADMLRRAAQG